MQWVLIVRGTEIGKSARASLANDKGETHYADVPYSLIRDVAYLRNTGCLAVSYSERSDTIQLDISGSDKNIYDWISYAIKRDNDG